MTRFNYHSFLASNILFNYHPDKLASGLVGKESGVADAVARIFLSSGNSIVSPYSTSRSEIAVLLSMLTDSSRHADALPTVCNTLATIAASTTSMNPTDSASPLDGEGHADTVLEAVESPEVMTTGSLSEIVKNQLIEKAALTASKNAVETASRWAMLLVNRVPMSKCAKVALNLLSIVLSGSGHADIDTAKLSHRTCLFFSKSLIANELGSAGEGSKGLGRERQLVEDVVKLLQEHSQNESWHVRETVMIALTIGYYYFH